MNRTRLAAFSLAALILIFALATRSALATNGYQEGYPPPLLPTPTLAVPVEMPGEPPVEPYPSGGTDFNGQPPVPIEIGSGAASGEGNLMSEPSNTMPEEGSTPGRGIVFLWLGFITTSLIFLTSVFGSIILFTRRNES